MRFYKALDLIVLPICLIKCQIYQLNRVKKEAIRTINHLIDGADYNHKDYKIRTHVFGGFEIRNKRTNEELAGARRMVNGYVEFSDFSGKTLFFPEEFAQAYSEELMFSESIKFWHRKGIIHQVHSEIHVKPRHDEYRGIGVEEPYYNNITMRMDRDFIILDIRKEVYDLGEMYGNRINYTVLPASSPLEEIFVISNQFINEKIPRNM